MDTQTPTHTDIHTHMFLNYLYLKTTPAKKKNNNRSH